MDNSASRRCPGCESGHDRAILFVDETVDTRRITEFTFASRKVPEFMSYRMVRCLSCDLVYVESPPSQDELGKAYHQANFDSAEDANDAALAYIEAITPTLAQLPAKNNALEIGTGTGAFLDCLHRVGFRHVEGVEPSNAAISSAPPTRRRRIRESIFIEGDFEPESFDLICCFMTMEHVLDPSQIAKSVRRLLRPGGAFVTVTHDYRSLVNRALGKRSPIIDIEHMQLFSKRSVLNLFRRSGYEKIQIVDFPNNYALRYWLRLLPLSPFLKKIALEGIVAVNLDKLKLELNVGNFMTSGYKSR